MRAPHTDDPFAAFDGDRTVIKPAAGRAAREPSGQPDTGSEGAATRGGRELPLALDAMTLAGINPLVAVAMPMLMAAPRIRNTVRHPDPAGLRDSLAEGIRRFEAQARSQGLPKEQVIAGRYILCTLLDESAASTPWGGGIWSSQSLLVQFHNETWGGEKLFQLLSKLATNIEQNRNLLELLYVVMAFGFEGRFRVLDNGRAQLASVRARLQQMLLQGRPAAEKALSPRWQGHADTGTRIGDALPLWVLASITALVLGLVFVGLKTALCNHADTLFTQFSALDAKAAQVTAAGQPVATPPPVAAAKPRLSGFLKPEIDAGLVKVVDLADRSVITIKGDGFFEPGRADVADAVSALLPRIADALDSVPGRVLVVGHSDNSPIRTVRFPSNWHLSQARAETVKAQLTARLDPQRVRAEGRAESEPVADNATPAGRALNRRIEITLFVQQPD